MFTNKYPFFKRGNILKKYMLENLRDFPRDMFNIIFEDYSDGILKGCDLTVEEDQIIIGRGIIKHKSDLYFREDNTAISYQRENRELVLKLEFEQQEQEEYKLQKGVPGLTVEEELDENEMELARFKLRKGARLRADYRKFSDFNTEYNTINIIHAKYAGIKKPTLHPHIFNMFANIVYQGDTDDMLDLSFCSQILNKGCNSGRLVDNYLKRRLQLKKDEFTNAERYKYLHKIVRKVQKKKQPEKTKKPKNRQKIIID